jgi:hypothetical protein
MKRLAFLFLFAVGGCNGSTGSGLTSFAAFVGGPEGVAGAPFTFTGGADGAYQISLTEARFHLAAVYFNKTVPTSGLAAQPCILPGVYVDEVFGACSGSNACGVDVDLLSPQLVPFPTPGVGTLDEAVTAEVWLSGGDINATDDQTPILQVSGTATKDLESWPFTGLVTIGTNHTSPASNVATPGANPICRQRIVSPLSLINPLAGPSGVTIANGGTLTVRVDPTWMFDTLDFATLAPAGSLTTLTIPDDSSLVGEELFKGVISSAGLPQKASDPDTRVYKFDVSNPQ